MDLISQPWPWYVTGPILGLTVPLLLLLGNKKLGISSSLRHVCAACIPATIPYFRYDWKREIWNLFFVGGVLLGGVIAGFVLAPAEPVALLPDLFFTVQGLPYLIAGGFLVGFGTRYAGGCTSGHTIMGLSSLQWPSLLVTMAFFAGGLLTTHLILPLILP